MEKFLVENLETKKYVQQVLLIGRHFRTFEMPTCYHLYLLVVVENLMFFYIVGLFDQNYGVILKVELWSIVEFVIILGNNS